MTSENWKELSPVGLWAALAHAFSVLALGAGTYDIQYRTVVPYVTQYRTVIEDSLEKDSTVYYSGIILYSTVEISYIQYITLHRTRE